MTILKEVAEGFEHILLVGAKPPVAFFAYPGKPSTQYPSHASLHVVTRPEQDAAAALQALVEALGAPDVALPDPGPRPQPASGAPAPEKLAQTLAALMPEHAIVSDESISFGRGFFKETHAAPPHDWLQITGGAIGCGIPLATGAAVGGGGRRVINLQADGSAMYTLQALWTQARQGLDVTTVVCSNRSYRILQLELLRAGVAEPGPQAQALTDLARPDLDWVSLAKGFGVPAVRVDRAEELVLALERALGEPGPHLIEAALRP